MASSSLVRASSLFVNPLKLNWREKVLVADVVDAGRDQQVDLFVLRELGQLAELELEHEEAAALEHVRRVGRVVVRRLVITFLKSELSCSFLTNWPKTSGSMSQSWK